MSESYTIARPYANALFELTKDKNESQDWLDFLGALCEIAETREFLTFVDNPKVENGVIVDLISDLVQVDLSTAQRNFLNLLIENKRIKIVRQIKELFSARCEEERGFLSVEVRSAFPLNEDEKNNLQQKLSDKFGKKCSLNVEIAKGLVGGVVVRVNDEVIDFSAQGRLEAFARSLA